MKSEFFIDSLEFLDDALLIEAEEKRVNRKKIIYIRTAVAAAACAVLVTIVGLVAGGPFTEAPRLLAGKDWRLLRESGLLLPEETDGPQFVAKVTETPETTVSPTEATHISRPTKRPSVVVTNRPGVSTVVPTTNAPTTNKPVTNTTAPSGNGYDESDPVPPQDDIPLPTSVVTTEKPEEWTTYIAKSETTEGMYGPEENFVMAWFASALDMEYVEPTATPEPTLEPTATPTVAPTEQPEATPPSTGGPMPEWTNPPILVTETPSATTTVPTETPSEPTYVPPTNMPPTETNTNTPAPMQTPYPDNEGGPNDSPSPNENDTWKYSLQIGRKTYIWQKREIPESAIKGYAGSRVLNGVSARNQKESTSVSTYSIKGVSSNFALTAKVKGVSGYYLFINESYVPKTLKEYVTDLNLKEYLKWDTLAVYGNKLTTPSVSSDEIWGILSNADGKRVDAKAVYMNNTLVAALAMDIEMYGYYDIPVALYKEGYVIISLFDQTYAFQIGAAKVAEIVN